jgi:hypothetical protein
MNFRAAIALLALAAPAFSQRGGMHAGSSGSRGFSGRSGFSGHAGFSTPGNFSRPAQPSRSGAFGGTGIRGFGAPNDSGLRTPYRGNRFMAGRSSSLARNAGLSRNWGRGADRDRDRFNARRRSFLNWYTYDYPGWLGYPYTIDPGFFDWGDSDNSAYDQAGAAPDYPAPEYPPFYPGEDYGRPGDEPAAAGPAFPAAPEQPLTVIFKSGRAPMKVQNYMMTATVLTDLDPQHYEQIPLDQIDQAETLRVNSAAGVEFQVPGASRD